MTRKKKSGSERAQPSEPAPARPEESPTTAEAGGATAPRPPPEAIVSESVLVSPKGKRYRVLRTTEQDAYDEPAPKPSPPDQK